MQLEVSEEITCKWQNLRSETNKYVSWALYLKLQAAGINFEKLLAWTIQSISIFFSFAHPLYLLFLLCYFNLSLKFQGVIFMFLLI